MKNGQILDGDLLDFPFGVATICHQANIENIMGAGIARQIKLKFPQTLKADTDYMQPVGSQRRLGCCSHANVVVNGETKRIINLYAQSISFLSPYGIPTNYHALTKSLLAMKGLAIGRIGIPFGMGCGLGGGSWDIVLDILNMVLHDTDYCIVRLEK